jgi:transposase-like protein
MEDYRRRRVLSLFYVAITRASELLSIVISGAHDIDETIAVLRRALEQNIAVGPV